MRGGKINDLKTENKSEEIHGKR